MKQITPQVLEEMSRRLVAALDPDMVVLFGSRARGDSRADSDVDLLIVRDSSEPKHKRAIAAYRALRGMGVPKDILWVTPGEAEEWRDVANNVVTRGLREGKVLYEKNPS